MYQINVPAPLLARASQEDFERIILASELAPTGVGFMEGIVDTFYWARQIVDIRQESVLWEFRHPRTPIYEPNIWYSVRMEEYSRPPYTHPFHWVQYRSYKYMTDGEDQIFLFYTRFYNSWQGVLNELPEIDKTKLIIGADGVTELYFTQIWSQVITEDDLSGRSDFAGFDVIDGIDISDARALEVGDIETSTRTTYSRFDETNGEFVFVFTNMSKNASMLYENTMYSITYMEFDIDGDWSSGIMVSMGASDLVDLSNLEFWVFEGDDDSSNVFTTILPRVSDNWPQVFHWSSVQDGRVMRVRAPVGDTNGSPHLEVEFCLTALYGYHSFYFTTWHGWDTPNAVRLTGDDENEFWLGFAPGADATEFWSNGLSPVVWVMNGLPLWEFDEDTGLFSHIGYEAARGIFGLNKHNYRRSRPVDDDDVESDSYVVDYFEPIKTWADVLSAMSIVNPHISFVDGLDWDWDTHFGQIKTMFDGVQLNISGVEHLEVIPANSAIITTTIIGRISTVMDMYFDITAL